VDTVVKADTPARAPNAAERLATLAYDDMRAVDALILERMASEVALIPELAEYLISAGGKRVRPMITVAAARMIGHRSQDELLLAAAVEFIHTATLLHDDVVDQSDLRRGRKPANLVWGNAPSVLVGDFLFARAFMLMVDAGSMDALNVLSRAASTIAAGEVHQLEAVGKIDVAVSDYMDIIDAKTAALFAAAAQVSPIIAGRSKDEEEALRTYGRELGLAFQLVDDALDYGGLDATLGKKTGDDFREGKVTLPIAIALEAAGPEERAFWERVIVKENQAEGDFAQALELMRRHGALAATVEAARTHAANARKALSGFPENEWREALENLADFVVERAY
jgi:octaprenyl-diphosphate synthase